MADIYPTQTRQIDPYSSYNSNVVNALTRMISRGANCLHGVHAIDVEIDPGTPLTQTIVKTGQCFKDDVLISIDSDFTVDLTDADFYVSGPPWNEAGYYLITLAYTYAKSIPAPRASIKIFKPSQHASLTSGYLFLKCLEVSFNGSTFQLDAVHDWVPDNTSIKREYAQFYVGKEDTVPEFVHERDEGRVIYVEDKDEIYFGMSTRWETLTSIRDNMDTTGGTAGQLAYVSSSGAVLPAIATGYATFADCGIVQVGTLESGDGKVRLFGRLENVPIETSRQGYVSVGDKMFLSDTEAGSVTNLMPEPYTQGVGVCIDSTSSTTCTIWFMPGSLGGGGDSDLALYDRYQDLFLASIFKYLFVDAFINDDYVDTVNTTATLDAVNYQIVGQSGEYYFSTNVTDPNCDSTCVIACQLSASVTNEENVILFASNNGFGDWENVNLDELHVFSTVKLSQTGQTGWFTPGNWVTGAGSGKRGVVCGHNINHVLLSNETGTNSWINGEVLTEDDTGYTTFVNGDPVIRNNCTEMMICAYFTGDASIQDLGLLYDQDIEVDETEAYNSRNIETLYGDIYKTAYINNDGLRVYPFLDSTAFPELHIIERTDTLSEAIVSLDNHSQRMGLPVFDEGDTTPSVADKYRAYKVCDSTTTLAITMLDDAQEGQEVSIIHGGGSSVTITNGTYMHLQGSGDFVMGIYDTITLLYVNSATGWVEICRSNN